MREKGVFKKKIMARFKRADNRNLENLLDTHNVAKIGKNNVTTRQPSRKLVPGRGLEFNNLSYSVIKKQKKDGVWINKEAYLLHDISGQAIRGEVMAIMGPSGAGKSTFLDALAGRIARGSLEGSVRIDGKPVSISTCSLSIFIILVKTKGISQFFAFSVKALPFSYYC